MVTILLGSGLKASDIKEVSIINQLGQIVYRQQGYSSTVQVSQLAKGTYVLKLQGQNATVSKRLIIE